MPRKIVEALREDPSRVNRLPVWAQDLVWSLCGEIESMDKALQPVSADGSDTFEITYGIGKPDQPLGASPLIGFYPAGVKDRGFHVRLGRDGKLTVDALGGGLAIEPQVSNSIRVEHRKN